MTELNYEYHLLSKQEPNEQNIKTEKEKKHQQLEQRILTSNLHQQRTHISVLAKIQKGRLYMLYTKCTSISKCIHFIQTTGKQVIMQLHTSSLSQYWLISIFCQYFMNR
jgi:HKD family nuclease